MMSLKMLACEYYHKILVVICFYKCIPRIAKALVIYDLNQRASCHILDKAYSNIVNEKWEG